MYNPLVSIVIPVYNGSNYLAEAIDSALAQTYENIEIIVVNDGSQDEGATEQIALSYGDKIRYFTKENGGVSSALNVGIENMRGEWLSWLSHDDLYTENKITLQISKAQESKYDNTIILCSGSLMDSEKKPTYHLRKKINKQLSGEELFQEFLKGYNLNGLGFLIPKTAIDQCGLFDESMRYLQDLDYWLRLMRLNYTFLCHKDLLVMTRIHKEQTTNTHSEIFDIDRNTLLDKHIAELKSLSNDQAIRLLKLYYLLSCKGNNSTGINNIPPILKEKNEFGLALQYKAWGYSIKGKIREFMRNIYTSLFIQKSRDRWR